MMDLGSRVDQWGDVQSSIYHTLFRSSMHNPFHATPERRVRLDFIHIAEDYRRVITLFIHPGARVTRRPAW